MSLPVLRAALLTRSAPALLGWALLAILQVILGRCTRGNQAADPKLPDWVKVSLTATELSLLAVVLFSAAALAAGLGELERRKPSRGVRTGSSVLRSLGLWTFLLLWCASWIMFQGSGRFVDQRTLQFVFTNGGVMFEYLRAINLALLIGGLAATVAATAAWLLLVPRLLGRIPARVRDSGVRILFAVLAGVFVVALAGQLGHGTATGGVVNLLSKSTHPLPKVYENRRDLRTGPLTYALVSVLRSGSDRSLPSPASDFTMVCRPQVPMDQVLKGVDRTGAGRPNVLVILVDSLRADHLAAYGADREVMPNLNALAKEGRVYLDTRTQSTHTNYATPCPLSSNYPLRSENIHIYPGGDAYPRIFLWDVLKPLGYRTAMVASQDERWGNMMGYMRTEGIDDVLQPSGRTVPDGDTVDRAIQWIEGEGNAPFFIYLNFQNPHWPYPVPDSWPRRFGKPRKFQWSFVFFDPSHLLEVRNLYADALAYTDEQIGRLIEMLKRSGRWDRTLVVVTADHGEAFLEHGFAGHASQLYDEVTKVPLIFLGPGVEPGTDRRPAQLIDIPPTVLGLLGLPTHPCFQGLDLRSKDFPAERSRFMIVHTTLANQIAVERGGYKLIHDRELDLDLLFDLRKDPGETTDQVQALPQITRDLGWRLSVWRRLQLDYFTNPTRCRQEYPPGVRDN